MSAIVEDWSPGTSVAAQPPVYSVLESVLPRSLTTPHSPDLLQTVTDAALPFAVVMQWLALENWLYSYADRVPTAQSWEDVKGLVEACYHCCRLEEWAVAYQLVCWPVGPQHCPLYQCIDHWGQHQSQIEIFADLKGKLSPTVDLLCLDRLGHAHRHLGDYQQAQNCHTAQLKLAQSRGDDAAEMDAYWGLSTIHISATDFCSVIQREAHRPPQNLVTARAYCERHYALAHRLGDLEQQARALHKWGRSYRQPHDLSQGIKQGIPLLKRALALATTLSDRALEAKILAELGIIHFFAGNYSQGQGYLEEALAPKYQTWIAQAPEAEIFAVMTLSFNQYFTGKIDEGSLGLEKIIDRCQAINDVFLELVVLHNVAVCLGQYNVDRAAAIGYSQKALDLALRFGFFRVAIANAASLAVLYELRQDAEAAQAKLQQAVELYQRYHPFLENEAKGIYFAYVAHAKWLQGQHLRSILSLAHCLVLVPPWSGANGQLIWRKAVATLTPPLLRPLVQRLKNQRLNK